MTDMDIERLREWAIWREKSACHHKCGETGHCGCAVLALIERLEKVEAQRDRLAALPESAYREGWNSGYTKGMADGHPLNHGASFSGEDWPDSDTRESLNTITMEDKNR